MRFVDDGLTADSAEAAYDRQWDNWRSRYSGILLTNLLVYMAGTVYAGIRFFLKSLFKLDPVAFMVGCEDCGIPTFTPMDAATTVCYQRELGLSEMQMDASRSFYRYYFDCQLLASRKEVKLFKDRVGESFVPVEFGKHCWTGSSTPSIAIRSQCI